MQCLQRYPEMTIENSFDAFQYDGSQSQRRLKILANESKYC